MFPAMFRSPAVAAGHRDPGSRAAGPTKRAVRWSYTERAPRSDVLADTERRRLDLARGFPARAGPKTRIKSCCPPFERPQAIKSAKNTMTRLAVARPKFKLGLLY